MSLRLRLTLIVLLVAGLSLATAGVLVRNYIARSLNETLDERADSILAGPILLDASRIVVRGNPEGTTRVAGGSQLPDGAFGAGRSLADSGLFVQVLDSEGAVLREIFDNSNDELSKPQLDEVKVADVPGVRQRFETASVVGSNPANYRVSLATRSTADAGVVTMLVAIPTTDRDSTLSHLVKVEVLATIVGLLLAAVASLVLVGAGLRPLRRIEDAAAIIVDGDLSHRVLDDEGPTETIRLGRALNSMMAQIEQAFAAKEASQQQLRQFVADAVPRAAHAADLDSRPCGAGPSRHE